MCLRELGAPVAAGLTEADIENLATDWFRALGYDCALGSEISPEGARPLRDSVTEPALATPLRAAIARLNPSLPPSWTCTMKLSSSGRSGTTNAMRKVF